MKVRTEIDGTVTLLLSDGRRFVIRPEENDATFSLESIDGDLLVKPISSTAVEIDTPYD